MPYNNDLLSSVVKDYSFELDYSIKCIESNRHNHITATYHLIHKKNKRNSSMRENM
jgi:hypothetical protein